MKKTILASALMAIVFNCAYAQEAVSIDSVEPDEQFDAEPEMSDPPPTVGAILQTEYEDWLEFAKEQTINGCKASGRDLRSDACDLEKNIISGEAVVSVSKSHSRWIEARQMAYVQAMNEAYSNYAQQMNASNQVRIISRMLTDDNRLEAPSKAVQVSSYEDGKPGKITELFNKVYALGEGFIDQKLREFNVDPAKYERQPIEVKKKLFENSVQQLAEFAASAETSGMVPMQTFYGEDAMGKYGVKVVFTTAPSRVSLVRQMLKEGANIAADPQKASKQTIAERFKLPGKEMFDLMGTRLVYDENGYPTLLAFGQASVSVPRNHPTFAQREQVARSMANSNAVNALTLLLKSSTNVKRLQSQNSGTTTQQSMTVDAQDNASFAEITEDVVKAYFDQTIDTSARISNFEGMKTLHSWSYYDRDSQKYVLGSVVMWSPVTAMQTKAQKQALKGPQIHSEVSGSSNNGTYKYESKSKRAKDTENYVF